MTVFHRSFAVPVAVKVEIKKYDNKCSLGAGALVQWLWEMTYVREAMGSNPGVVYWMGMIFFHIDLL